MTHMFDPDSIGPIAIRPGEVANVSRRFVLKGVVSAGALVLGTSRLDLARCRWDGP